MAERLQRGAFNFDTGKRRSYRQVKSRLDLTVRDLGTTQLKNIAELVRVYALEVGRTTRVASRREPIWTPDCERRPSFIGESRPIAINSPISGAEAEAAAEGDAGAEHDRPHVQSEAGNLEAVHSLAPAPAHASPRRRNRAP
jgi:hypothetical protein